MFEVILPMFEVKPGPQGKNSIQKTNKWKFLCHGGKAFS